MTIEGTPRTPFQNLVRAAGVSALASAAGVDPETALVVADIASAAYDRLGKKRSRYRSLDMEIDTPAASAEANQDAGNRLVYSRSVYGGKKKRTRISKVLNSTIIPVHQALTWRYRTKSTTSPYAWADNATNAKLKYMISEFTPGTGGFMPIPYAANTPYTDLKIRLSPSGFTSGGVLPLHLYDLTYFNPPADGPISTYQDCIDRNVLYDTINVNDPAYPGYVTMSNQMCGDINARAWILNGSGTFNPIGSESSALQTIAQPRWQIVDTEVGNNYIRPSSGKAYLKDITVDMTCYGTKKLPTEFDIRIIRITDRRFAPDLDPLQVNPTAGGVTTYTAPTVLSPKELEMVKDSWLRLARPYCQNPMVRRLENHTPPVKRWFQTVCKKRVKLGEQTTSIDCLPAVITRLVAKVNEVQSHKWDDYGWNFTSGADAVPAIDDTLTTVRWKTRPWYSSRLYLMIRAVCPADNSNVSNIDGLTTQAMSWLAADGTATTAGPAPGGITSTDYTPSYDLAVRARYLVNSIPTGTTNA